MAFSLGEPSVTLEDILSKVSEEDIISHYLGVKSIPCVINSPLRRDKNPSFGLYSTNGKRIYYKDFSTRERGGIFDLLSTMWGYSYKEVLAKINADLNNINKKSIINSYSYHSELIEHNSITDSTALLCKIREWRDYDIEYWASYGISLEWLKYAEVYPVSHKIIIKGNNRYVFVADKYAYVYVEHKEDKITLKIYQPFNTKYKWSNSHDKSVISLWSKIPEYGDKVCICAAMKDALCLSANLHIPALAVQGEGYKMSDTAVNELKRRYKEIYILFDNDEVGLKDGVALAESTKFTNIVLPDYGYKDISDLYKGVGKEKWVEIIKPLFINNIKS